MRKWLDEGVTRLRMAVRALGGDRFTPATTTITAECRRTCTMRLKARRGGRRALQAAWGSLRDQIGEELAQQYVATLTQREMLVTIHVATPMTYSFTGMDGTHPRDLLPGDLLNLKLTAYGIEASVKGVPRG